MSLIDNIGVNNRLMFLLADGALQLMGFQWRGYRSDGLRGIVFRDLAVAEVITTRGL